jgi:TnpA family transposase
MNDFAKNFSDEELTRDWTLSAADIEQIERITKTFQVYVAIQICAVRFQGNFVDSVQTLSPRVTGYLHYQLKLPPTAFVNEPERRATRSEYHGQILSYLEFGKYDRKAKDEFERWVKSKAEQGVLPTDILELAEDFLVKKKVILPSRKVLERQIGSLCSKVHAQIFETIYSQLPKELKENLDRILVTEDKQVSFFARLKESPPSATITSLQVYLEKYAELEKLALEQFDISSFAGSFVDYLVRLAKYYDASKIKRFGKEKRLSLLFCFLLETRKELLDNLVKMHDQYILDLTRRIRNKYEKKQKKSRNKNKRAVVVLLKISETILNQDADASIRAEDLIEEVGRENLQEAIADLKEFKRLTERGYADMLISHYPSLRKYFSDFLRLPFEAEEGSEDLLEAIKIVRRLDANELSKIPDDAPVAFVPGELKPALRDVTGKLKRNAWEMSLALAIKDNLRSGNLYIPKSKQHISFWKMLLEKNFWEDHRQKFYTDLNQPSAENSAEFIKADFHKFVGQAEADFGKDGFARIKSGKLQIGQDKKLESAEQADELQAIIDAGLPLIRIENLLIEVDREIGFTKHFTPLQKHQSRPPNFYKTLVSAILSQATNLGIVAMSASVEEISVGMIRHTLNSYVREETLKNANAEIVNYHHRLPISKFYGAGEISSSDGQRFRLRADSLLASYYPRYYGYYDKAISIYTHVSDQYSVFNTKVISCSPREALYVLDGLLENNTILKPKAHTTDTHGYTEVIFALCHLLGFYFMPRIRDIKQQQLYKPDKNYHNKTFSPLLKKSVNLDLITEQWDAMMRVVISLQNKTVPAHLIVQKLISGSPSDRLSRAFRDFGRLTKTQYILRYLSDSELRRTVRIQLNKGEYRHKLPRWIFFANQGIFSTSDFEEIMNKASCLSLVSNCILYWNTKKIGKIMDELKKRGIEYDEEVLTRISLLPHKHVLPQGTYFVNTKK